jgi:metal-dependent amidase/aminoacylase/carboxypeptidase family protein
MQTRHLMAAPDRQVPGAAGSADVDPRVAKLKALVDADVSSPAMFDLGAWVARWGSGQPVIAFGSDIDGIPQGSQKPGVAYHDPMVEGAPGHAEGHNSGTPLNIVAALAVKRVMER